jgi:hypothetical protein
MKIDAGHSLLSSIFDLVRRILDSIMDLFDQFSDCYAVSDAKAKAHG